MIIRRNPQSLSLDLKKPHILLASWFGTGFLLPAPGTWGSLAALPPGLLLYSMGGPGLLAIMIFLISGLGFWACRKFSETCKEEDSPMIVIDEVAGQWIPLLIAGINPILVLVSFLSFRFFDILKPWPLSFIDRHFKNSWGVIADDIFAGLYAALCVLFFQALFGI